ncbi:MAG TPA: sigma-70 family RNA polymerase sigma factor [Chitinophagaceae bacterium]|jgi:RNA polymerase sigma factor (sigma-70 family)|nr:sigma-70 family RNA polymerase sigma factor [Chitinophagaceae bacterium]
MSTTLIEVSEQLSDEEIFELFKDELSKEKAFTILVKKYQERLYWHIRRFVIHHEDTNDVLQNVFIKAWKSLSNFRQESGLYTWLYRIGTNESLTYLEKLKKKRSVSISDEETGMSNRVRAEKGFDINKLEWKLQLAIQSLPEKQRAVFTLRYYDEMPYEKMSEVLDTSVGSLKASYHHASKKVEEFILREN